MFVILQYIPYKQARQKQNWIGPAEPVTACESMQQLGGPKEHFSIWCSEIASEAIFGHFFSPICSFWQAGFWFSLARQRVSKVGAQWNPSITDTIGTQRFVC